LSGALSPTQEASQSVNTATASQPIKISVPPIVELNLEKNQIIDSSEFVIKGKVIPSEFTEIVSTEISNDGGINWTPLILIGNNFTYRFNGLEDNDYKIIVRALDDAGSYGYSKEATLVVDKLKPLIGGSSFNLGPIFLNPNSNGLINSIIDEKNNIVVSTQGGVVEATVVSNGKTFNLERIADTNLWHGGIIFNQDGLKDLKIIVKDGAGSSSERVLNQIMIHKSGVVIDQNNNPISGAKISVFYFDDDIQDWVEWDGESFGQKNPHYTDRSGRYSFYLPAGEYYLKIVSQSYRQAVSNKFIVNGQSIISDNIKLESMPVFLNFLFPPQQFSVKPQQITNNNDLYQKVNIPLKDFEIADLNDKKLSIIADFPKKKIIGFISSWSNEAVDQLRILEEFSKENIKIPLVLIGLQDSSSQLNSLFNRGRYSLKGYVSQYGEAGEILGIKTLPEYYFINSQNKITFVYSGRIDKDTLFKLFNKLQ